MTDHEMTERGPVGGGEYGPVLLVHGAWHGAWCWSGFQDHLAAKGLNSFAVNLRGHGGRPNPRSLRRTRVSQYADDVSAAVDQIKDNTGLVPVIVGHSMGGLVTQKVLERRDDIPHAVLLASVPPQGVWRTTLDILLKHPIDFLMVNLTLSLWPLVDTPEKAKRLFFSGQMPKDEANGYFRQLQDESYFGFLDMLAFALPDTRKITTPLTVMGARDDVIFPPSHVERTARTYGVEALMFEDMAHDMMLDAGWQNVANSLIEIVANLNGPKSG